MLVVHALQDLTETSFSQNAKHLVAVSKVILLDHIIIAPLIVETCITILLRTDMESDAMEH